MLRARPWAQPGFTAAALLSMCAFTAAETIEEDMRAQPYFYTALGAFPSGSGGSSTWGIGAGMDFLMRGGFGLGGEVVGFGNQNYGFAIAALNASYHFAPSGQQLSPFVKVGFGTGGEVGYGGVSFVNVGGGVNLWKLSGAAIRIEALDRFPTQGGAHHVSVQLGLTF